MPRPSGNEVAEFSYQHLWAGVASSGAAERLNVRVEFVDFLKAKGHPGIIAEEYAEKNYAATVSLLKDPVAVRKLNVPIMTEVAASA